MSVTTIEQFGSHASAYSVIPRPQGRATNDTRFTHIQSLGLDTRVITPPSIETRTAFTLTSLYDMALLHQRDKEAEGYVVSKKTALDRVLRSLPKGRSFPFTPLPEDIDKITTLGIPRSVDPNKLLTFVVNGADIPENDPKEPSKEHPVALRLQELVQTHETPGRISSTSYEGALQALELVWKHREKAQAEAMQIEAQQLAQKRRELSDQAVAEHDRELILDQPLLPRALRHAEVVYQAR